MLPRIFILPLPVREAEWEKCLAPQQHCEMEATSLNTIGVRANAQDRETRARRNHPTSIKKTLGAARCRAPPKQSQYGRLDYLPTRINVELPPQPFVSSVSISAVFLSRKYAVLVWVAV